MASQLPHVDISFPSTRYVNKSKENEKVCDIKQVPQNTTSFASFSLPSPAPWGWGLPIFRPSLLSGKSLPGNFQLAPIRGRVYFSTPTVLGLATWFTLSLASFGAYSSLWSVNGIMSGVLNCVLWLSLFLLLSYSFSWGGQDLRSCWCSEAERHVEGIRTLPAAQTLIQQSPADVQSMSSWSADTRVRKECFSCSLWVNRAWL